MVLCLPRLRLLSSSGTRLFSQSAQLIVPEYRKVHDYNVPRHLAVSNCNEDTFDIGMLNLPPAVMPGGGGGSGGNRGGGGWNGFESGYSEVMASELHGYIEKMRSEWRLGRYETAMDVMATINSSEAPEDLLERAVNACEKAAEWEHAMSLVHKLRGLQADPSIISLAREKAFQKGVTWKDALGSVEEMCSSYGYH